MAPCHPKKGAKGKDNNKQNYDDTSEWKNSNHQIDANWVSVTFQSPFFSQRSLVSYCSTVNLLMPTVWFIICIIGYKDKIYIYIYNFVVKSNSFGHFFVTFKEFFLAKLRTFILFFNIEETADNSEVFTCREEE